MVKLLRLRLEERALALNAAADVSTFVFDCGEEFGEVFSSGPGGGAGGDGEVVMGLGSGVASGEEARRAARSGVLPAVS